MISNRFNQNLDSFKNLRNLVRNENKTPQEKEAALEQKEQDTPKKEETSATPNQPLLAGDDLVAMNNRLSISLDRSALRRTLPNIITNESDNELSIKTDRLLTNSNSVPDVKIVNKIITDAVENSAKNVDIKSTKSESLNDNVNTNTQSTTKQELTIDKNDNEHT